MQKEKTLVLIKPDGVQRNLVGEIIHRFERTGLKLIAMKLALATKEQALEQYKKNEEWLKKKGGQRVEFLRASGKKVEKSAQEYGINIVNANVNFVTAGPVVLMVWQGNKAVGIIKKIVGGTEPLTSDVGTIRGDFTIDSFEISDANERCVRNVIHCTDNPEEAEREIAIWFKPEELLNYRLMNEVILYDVNLDGILE
ncbi:MAG: nucleoside-diphosphate kinase [Minisyncoccia bacterium]